MAAPKLSNVTKRQKVRALEAKRDQLMIKVDQHKTDLARTRADLKRARAAK